MSKHLVAEGNAIYHNGRTFSSGEEFPVHTLAAERLESLVKSGALVVVGETEETQERSRARGGRR